MSTFRNPVGPQPSSVYWRRRIMVGLGLLAVIIVIILIVVQPRGEATPNPTDAPTNSQTPKAEDPSTPCLPANIDLTPVTDSNHYAPGVLPQLSLTIVNTGSTACTINAGSTMQELRITSGSEQIWSSRDCQTAAVDAETILQPNVPQSTSPIPWDRTRSSTTTCQGDRPAVIAGGASYHLTVFVGDIESESTKQFILD